MVSRLFRNICMSTWIKSYESTFSGIEVVALFYRNNFFILLSFKFLIFNFSIYILLYVIKCNCWKCERTRNKSTLMYKWL